MFEGKAVKLNQLDNGVVELVFDYVEESVNKFDRTALADWRKSVDLLQENAHSITGLLVRSAKGQFIVGADIIGKVGSRVAASIGGHAADPADHVGARFHGTS